MNIKRQKREKSLDKIREAKKGNKHEDLEKRIEAIEEYLNLDI